MPDPVFKFDKEEFTLTITGLTGGWTIGNLGEIKLFDYAQVQFPSSWSQFKIGAATKIFDAQWKIHGPLLLEQTLKSGITYTLKDGTGGSAASTTDLVYHLLKRPTVTIDLKLNVELEGKATSQGFEGSAVTGLSIGGHF